ncbi:uncharacterized protein N7473_008454 [Penicillium subrubescens]|uniref:uncharacterized protein n=1 Tax=Penicillium subrubescens TaxID=1316194 RepID=UPI002544DDAF|nr:uncharacterized protein N7473_008454 [Penicillium subrubescens]KAJ5892226.1 hypothetical protein N7473_008454 [Penicillium subrubescens]
MSSTKDENDLNKDPAWFLINLIMHTEAKKLEKIDWNGFIEEMGIKSKGAAVKRYERIMASYGLNTTYLPKPGTQTACSAQAESSAAGPGSSPPRRKALKRKHAEVEESEGVPDSKDNE